MNIDTHPLYTDLVALAKTLETFLSNNDLDYPVRIGLLPDYIEQGVTLFYSDIIELDRKDQVILNIFLRDIYGDPTSDFIFAYELKEHLAAKNRGFSGIAQETDEKGQVNTVLAFEVDPKAYGGVC